MQSIERCLHAKHGRGTYALSKAAASSIDGLRNGAYRVRAVGEDGKPAGSVRAVTVSGDYAFEVDLSVATAAAKAR